jgi:hypothetical protein
VGQSAAASGVKFWPGPSSALSKKVASGLVWRFDTFNCVSDNLSHFENGLGNSGSFLDVGNHRFYVAKPFPEEVTDVFDPLCNGGSSCSESSSLGAMVDVGVIPNRYTCDVVLNQQARVAHQGWYGGCAIPGGPTAEVATAVLNVGAYGRSLDRPMATTDDRPMADPETAHSELP